MLKAVEQSLNLYYEKLGGNPAKTKNKYHLVLEPPQEEYNFKNLGFVLLLERKTESNRFGEANSPMLTWSKKEG